MMITKKEIIDVLVEQGLSIIESNRILDTKEDFRLAVQDVIDKAIMHKEKPTQKLYTAREYNELKKILCLMRSHLKKSQSRSQFKDRKSRLMNRHLKFLRDRIDYLLKHNFTKTFKYQ